MSSKGGSKKQQTETLVDDGSKTDDKSNTKHKSNTDNVGTPESKKHKTGLKKSPCKVVASPITSSPQSNQDTNSNVVHVFGVRGAIIGKIVKRLYPNQSPFVGTFLYDVRDNKDDLATKIPVHGVPFMQSESNPTEYYQFHYGPGQKPLKMALYVMMLDDEGKNTKTNRAKFTRNIVRAIQPYGQSMQYPQPFNAGTDITETGITKDGVIEDTLFNYLTIEDAMYLLTNTVFDGYSIDQVLASDADMVFYFGNGKDTVKKHYNCNPNANATSSSNVKDDFESI